MTNLKFSNEDLLTTVKSKAAHERQLDQLKSRYSHKNQNPTMAELLELMADELLQKSKQHDAKPAPVRSANPRYISKVNRNFIRTRGTCR